MKKTTIFLTTIIALWATTTALQAQDREWLWAKAYSGNGNDGAHNTIVKSAFDDDGNVYIIGSFREPAKIDGERILPYFMSSGMNYPGQVIAKFDIDGNLVWKKVIKFYKEIAYPLNWLQIRGDRLYVMGEVEMAWDVSNFTHLYYLDTLVYYNDVDTLPLEECTLPFSNKYERMTYFITFDLDGKVIDQHFLQYDDRDIRPGGTPRIRRFSWAYNNTLPFYVDKTGNIYIITNFMFYGLDPSKPLYTVIDNETLLYSLMW